MHIMESDVKHMTLELYMHAAALFCIEHCVELHVHVRL